MEIKSVLFIGFVWPEANSSAAGSRMMQLIRYFKDLGAKITFASAAKPGSHPSDLRALGVDNVSIKLNDSSFDDFIKTLQPEAVVFDRYMTEEQFGWRVAESCPDSIRILDTEDLHSLRAVRERCSKSGVPFTEEKLLSSELAKRELASIYRSDLSLIISEFELQLLEDLFGVSPDLLLYLPLVVEQEILDNKEWQTKHDFVFIGNFMHSPNWDAVLNLKNNIWPRIRQNLPGVNLHIYGAYTSEKVSQLHHKQSGFLVHGWAQSAREVFQSARVCLAPIRFGAGLKGKLLEAMHFGTPNVTTSVGAEGIQGNMPWGGFIEDQWDAFSMAAVTLYTDEKSWNASREGGYKLINDRFDTTVHFKGFQNRLLQMIPDLKSHRNKNFIGAMLTQQTTSASKYLSKWIEAKNRKN